MSHKLPAGCFKWFGYASKFNKDFIKNCHEEIDEGYFLECDVQYPEKLHDLLNDLQFLLERNKNEKF